MSVRLILRETLPGPRTGRHALRCLAPVTGSAVAAEDEHRAHLPPPLTGTPVPVNGDTCLHDTRTVHATPTSRPPKPGCAPSTGRACSSTPTRGTWSPCAAS